MEGVGDLISRPKSAKARMELTPTSEPDPEAISALSSATSLSSNRDPGRFTCHQIRTTA